MDTQVMYNNDVAYATTLAFSSATLLFLFGLIEGDVLTRDLGCLFSSGCLVQAIGINIISVIQKRKTQMLLKIQWALYTAGIVIMSLCLVSSA